MELHKTLTTLLERHDGWQTAAEYGEPGYSITYDITPMVVLGDYWCECTKFGMNEQSNIPRGELHDFANHHPRIWAQLEQQGVNFEWYDEWTIDYDHDKAYRTSGDCYQWMPSHVRTDSGDLLTADDDIVEWVEWALDDPAMRCLLSRITPREQIITAGFFIIHDRLENGLHQGMDDDPAAFLDMERGRVEGETFQFLFMLDETSQFYITYSMWARLVDGDDNPVETS